MRYDVVMKSSTKEIKEIWRGEKRKLQWKVWWILYRVLSKADI